MFANFHEFALIDYRFASTDTDCETGSPAVRLAKPASQWAKPTVTADVTDFLVFEFNNLHKHLRQMQSLQVMIRVISR